jgi:hypothetical protein
MSMVFFGLASKLVVTVFSRFDLKTGGELIG